MIDIPAEALILVAVMNNPRDLEIARVLGWYRIPLKTAPKVVQVDYLAFYQTAGFGKRRWCIENIAPVRGHELVTRAELLKDADDHPRSRDLYYKLQLGPLKSLSEPIQAERWKRITFFYTLGEHLNRARTVSELVVESGERQFLWQALKERAQHSSPYNTDFEQDFDIDPALLGVLLAASHQPPEKSESSEN